MFGIGSTELLIILVVALLVLGPKSLASVSRSLGKVIGEFRRVSTDFQRALNVEAAQEEARQEAAKHREAAAKEAGAKARTAPQEQTCANAQIARTAAPQPGQPDGTAERIVLETITLERDEAGPPPDSPLGQAIAKARAQAAGQPGAAKAAPGGAA